MIPSPWTHLRLLVPRWRGLSRTISAGELGTPARVSERKDDQQISSELRHKLERWWLNPGIVSAGELVGAALVSGSEKNRLVRHERLSQQPLRQLNHCADLQHYR